MIKLTRLDGSEIYLNPDLMETMEETPDTHITLMNGDRFLVLEKARAIVEKIVVFKARVIHRAQTAPRQKFLRKQRVGNYLPVDKRDTPE